MLTIYPGGQPHCPQDGHDELQSLLVEDCLDLEPAARVPQGGGGPDHQCAAQGVGHGQGGARPRYGGCVAPHGSAARVTNLPGDNQLNLQQNYDSNPPRIIICMFLTDLIVLSGLHDDVMHLLVTLVLE